MMERLVQRILASGMLTKHSVCADKMQEITHVIFRDLSRVLDIYYQVLEERRVEASQYVLDHSREFSHRMSLVSDDVQSVATAVDQMDSSISNISKNVDESSNYARAASERADSAAESMQSVQPRRKRSDHSCQSLRKLQTKPNFWPSTRQSKLPARVRRAKGSPWLPTKFVNWPKAPKAAPAMWQ